MRIKKVVRVRNRRFEFFYRGGERILRDVRCRISVWGGISNCKDMFIF